MTRKNRTGRRKKLNIAKVLIALIILTIIVFAISKLLLKTTEILIYNDYYLSSNTNEVVLYKYDADNEIMMDIDNVYRGVKVSSNNKTKIIGDITYVLVNLNDTEYYVKKDALVSNESEVVKETTKYVRTSVTVYQNETDSKIASFIKKGNKLDVIGYDYIDSEGNVNMYKIKYDDIEGWVYQKYLVDTETESLENYNESGVYDIHKDRKYSRELYGGYASTLDYYPYESSEFPNNPLLKTAKAMYLNAGTNVISQIDSYLEIATTSGVNAIVVDIKDGALAYPSEVAKTYSMTAYNSAMNKLDTYQNAIKKIKDAGIYAIGRIVVFNDSHFGKDHPDECIKSSASSRLWPSAYSRLAWEYNVELAKEAVDLMGFNEIQFDYVRFPEDSYNMSTSSSTNFQNKYNEEKAEAVQNFLFYATDQIHKKEAYLSVDVFGECSGTYVTSYGQYWPAISNIVDVISSMPYTDHFGKDNNTWSNPYKTVNNWAKGAATRQTEIPTPAIARTWITAYDTPHWNPTITYDATKISDQARALVDAGLDGGFITWNSASSLSKYNQIKSAFNKDY